MYPGLEEMTLLTYPEDHVCPMGHVCPRVALTHRCLKDICCPSLLSPLSTLALSQSSCFQGKSYTLYTEGDSSTF